MTFDHKKELKEVCEIAVRDFLGTMRGAQIFGAGAELYQGRESGTLVLKAGDGHHFFIKVQKSSWRSVNATD